MGSYWRPEILSEVVRHLKEGSLYLFAGAGLSCLAGYPSWKGLLRQFAIAYGGLPGCDPKINSIMEGLVDEGKLNILDHLISLGNPGGDAIVQILQQNFEQEKTSNTHRTLINLPFAGYVTTNYDRSIEAACVGVAGAEEMVNDRWFCFPQHKHAPVRNLDDVYDGQRFILHMHGCLYYGGRLDSENIMLMTPQYCKFYKSGEIGRVYNDLFYRPFLILGASLSDTWFMNKLFEARDISDRDRRNERKLCYVLRPESEKRQIDPSDEEVYGVKFNYFDEKDKDAIDKMVNELKNACEETTVRVTPGEAERT
jgi:hypothetical protein